MNPFSEADRLDLMERAAFEAVQKLFSHLPVEHIRKPPRHLMDAKLARQIAIRIMNVDFNAPRRRITTMQGRQRTSISFAIQTVDRRLENEVFRAAYERTANIARARYSEAVQKAMRSLDQRDNMTL